MEIDRNGLDVLSREECLTLLRRAHIGRVAVSVDALPAVLPVNFTVVGEDVVFRTSPGAKLDAALANNVVAFEVDNVDPLYQTGWSVLVQGMAREVVEPAQVAEMRKAPLRAWAGNGGDHFVRIPTGHVSGRRIRPERTSGASAYPVEWELDAILPDGTTAHVRPIRPSDAAGLVVFHAGLSFETVYSRFFGVHPALSDKEVERFTTVDYHDRFALLVTLDDQIVAVARYDRVSPEAAEVAFVVADAHQGRGIGAMLLEQLAGAARERGIRRFVAETLAANTAMLTVFREAGFGAQTTTAAGGVVHVEFPIAGPLVA